MASKAGMQDGTHYAGTPSNIKPTRLSKSDHLEKVFGQRGTFALANTEAR